MTQIVFKYFMYTIHVPLMNELFQKKKKKKKNRKKGNKTHRGESKIATSDEKANILRSSSAKSMTTKTNSIRTDWGSLVVRNARSPFLLMRPVASNFEPGYCEL